MWEIEYEYTVVSEFGTEYGTFPTETQAESRIFELEEDPWWDGEPPEFRIEEEEIRWRVH